LEQLDAIAHQLLDINRTKDMPTIDQKPSSSKAKNTTATSALLSLVNARLYPAFLSKESLLTQIST
jgi:hypothetical protein